MIALLIASLVVQVMYSVIYLAQAYEVEFVNPTFMEVEMMSSQMMKEARLMRKLGVKNGNTLELYPNSGSSVVTYRINENKLIRQINGAGGEVYLYQCKALRVSLVDEQTANLTITTTKNEDYQIYLSTLNNESLIQPITIEEDEVIPDVTE